MREKIAAIQHIIWAHWMKHVFSLCKHNADGSYTISAGRVAYWKQEMATPYFRLNEAQKDSDREQADKVLAVLADRSLPVALVTSLNSLGDKAR